MHYGLYSSMTSIDRMFTGDATEKVKIYVSELGRHWFHQWIIVYSDITLTDDMRLSIEPFK